MPQIRVKNGPQKGKILPVQGSTRIVIGRDGSCQLQINDKGVSREHAEIFRLGEMVFIRDLESRNGSFVNEEKVVEELLREGDVVRVGGTQLLFESRRAAQEEGRDLKYEEGQTFKTSLELKVDDLYVLDASSGREGDMFKAICQATQIVQGERDEKKLFERLMDLIQEYIPADHIYLFLKDETTGAVTPRAMRQKAAENSVPISRSILRRVISESRSILTADAMQDERFKADDSIVMHQIRSVLCVPIQGSAQAIGAIYAVNTRAADTFEQSDLQLITAMGAQLALSLENLASIRLRRKMFLQTIARLVALLEGANPGQRGHAERVSTFTSAIATELNLNDHEILLVSLAGLLHDIGKVPAVSGLSPAASERSSGVAHVLAGIEFLKDMQGLQEALPSIRAHHERYDGQGFPDKLKGETIPLGGRIVAVANNFDKLIFPPGNAHASLEPDPTLVRKAFIELEQQSEKAYDPKVVRALIVAYRHGAMMKSTPKLTAVNRDLEKRDIQLQNTATPPYPLPALPDLAPPPSSETIRSTPLEEDETTSAPSAKKTPKQ